MTSNPLLAVYAPHGAGQAQALENSRQQLADYRASLAKLTEPELQELAEKLQAAKQRKDGERLALYDKRWGAPDFGWYAKYRTWSFEQAIALLCGGDPDLSTRQLVFAGKKSPYTERFRRLWAIGERAYEMAYLRGGGVAPVIAVQWARSLGWELPEQLSGLFPLDHPPAASTTNPAIAAPAVPEQLQAPRARSSTGKPWPGNTVASVFAKDAERGVGIKWDLAHWKSNLANTPAWLKPAKAVEGKRGGTAHKTTALWWPLVVADCLVDHELVQPFEVLKCFEEAEGIPEVAEWLDAVHEWAVQRKRDLAARASYGE